MTSFVLKIIAVVTMLFDHSGYLIFHKLSYFNYIGRFAFPIFAFQISEGYLHTKNLKKYWTRLGIFALISQIPFLLFKTVIDSSFLETLQNNPFSAFFTSLNIFFTLFLGLAAIIIYDKLEIGPSLDCKIFKLKFLELAIVAGICYLGELLHVDYGYFGVLLVFLFYLLKRSNLLTLFSYCGLVIFYFFPYLSIATRQLSSAPITLSNLFNSPTIMITVCTLFAITPILCYNKKQGKKLKYALYVFYPAHLLVIFLCNLLFF